MNSTDQRNVVVENDITAYGIFAERQVTNPSLDADDTVYVTMHAGTNGPWIEIGWARQPGSTTPEVFTCCANVGYLSWGQFFPIAPGDIIAVEVIALGNNQWQPMIYWNGQWATMNDYTLTNNYTTDGNVVIEAFSGADGIFPSVPQTNTYYAEEYVCNPGCGWQYEGSATNVSYAAADSPYCMRAVNAWYHWYGFGPQSPCP